MEPPGERAERRLAAILAADVVGYSRLIGQDEAATLARLKTCRRDVVDPQVAGHRGRIVKLMGDGILCEFGSVVDAVACAVAIQRGMAQREEGVPEAERLRFRIGVNLGDVVHEDGDLFGDGVNVAARLESLAEPGGVMVSGTAYDHLQGRLALPLDFAGARVVKNIAQPVRAYRVRLDGASPPRRPWHQRALPRRGLVAAGVLALLVLVDVGGQRWFRPGTPPGPPLPDRPSIAVLPLANLDADPKEQRLADGLTDDLIVELGRYRFLFVIARGSVLPYQGKAVDVRQVGRELGVRYVLQGTLERDGERVRVSVQLADALTGSQVWSQRYDRPMAGFFALRQDIVDRVAGTLPAFGGALAQAQAEAARRKPPASLEAYDHLAIARDVLRRGDSTANLAEAADHLDRALALDPGLGRAAFWLAWVRYDQAFDAAAGSADAARAWAAFDAAARQAEAVDPADAGVQAMAGLAYFRRRAYAPGELAWRRALELGPNDYAALREIGCGYASALGVERAAEGLEIVRRALRLNPLHPPWQLNCLGFAAYYAGLFEESVAAFLEANDPVQDNLVFLALAYAELGRGDDAAATRDRLLARNPAFALEAYLDNDIYRPGGSAARMMAASARKAGLPLCAAPDAAAALDPLNRLPECEARRAKAARS